jgi:hypothetical protein
MSGRVDAARQTADDNNSACGQIRGQPLGYGKRVRRPGA